MLAGILLEALSYVCSEGGKHCNCAQELCGLSKHLQVNNRGLLLTNLNNLGLFEVLASLLIQLSALHLMR